MMLFLQCCSIVQFASLALNGLGQSVLLQIQTALMVHEDAGFAVCVPNPKLVHMEV